MVCLTLRTQDAQFEVLCHGDIMRSLLPLLCLITVRTEGAGAADPGLPFMEYLDKNSLVCLEWGFDIKEGYITFKLTVNTTGWVGLGFSPSGGMEGADIVMGGLGPSGSYFKVSLSKVFSIGKILNGDDSAESTTVIMFVFLCLLGLSCHRALNTFG